MAGDLRTGRLLMAVEGAAALAFALVGATLLLLTSADGHTPLEAGRLYLTVFVLAAIVGFLPAMLATQALADWRALRPVSALRVAALFCGAVVVFWGVALLATWGPLYRDGATWPYLAADVAVALACAAAALRATGRMAIAATAGGAAFTALLFPTATLLGLVGPAVLVPVLAAALAAGLAFDQAARRQGAAPARTGEVAL